MKTPRHQISGIIAADTLRKGVSKQYARKIAAFLLAEHRVNDLDSIVRDVQADWADAGHLEVIADSAHELTPAVKTDITRKVRQFYPSVKQIAVEERRDPDVLGGVRLNLPGRQLDLTARAKLNKFKQLTGTGD